MGKRKIVGEDEFFGLRPVVVRIAIGHENDYSISVMVKTLASMAVIVVALGMAFGIKYVGDRNQAASISSDNQTSIIDQTPSFNGQSVEKNDFKLEITSDGKVIRGETEPLAEVMVNETELRADEKGNFLTEVVLDEGENEVVIVASDDEGNFAEKIITVSYEPVE